MLPAARKVDLSPVQRVPQPTRDVLVTRDESGEREFSGFGAAKNSEYADCFIDGDKMPEETIKVCSVFGCTAHPAAVSDKSSLAIWLFQLSIFPVPLTPSQSVSQVRRCNTMEPSTHPYSHVIAVSQEGQPTSSSSMVTAFSYSP